MQMVHFIPPAQRRIALEMAAQIENPLLIFGPDGSGKGEMARWIHANGPLAAKPYISFRPLKETAAGLSAPEAGKNQKGESLSRLEHFLQSLFLANSGTFVIPEVTELTLSEQRHLLDLLESHSLPIQAGSPMRRIARIRIIAMSSLTESELENRAKGAMFSFALYQKLIRTALTIPPLADRKEEFTDIVQVLLGEITRELHKEYVRQITPEAWEILRNYPWPGNIRELRNVLRYAAVRTTGHELSPAFLPSLQTETAPGSSVGIDFRKTREEFEKVYLAELLKSVDGDIARASERTGIAPGLLRDKVVLHGLAQRLDKLL